MLTKSDKEKLKQLDLSRIGGYRTSYMVYEGNKHIMHRPDDICFIRVFDHFISTTHYNEVFKRSYTIFLCTPRYYRHKNNLCFLKRKEIVEYLQILKNYFSFTFKLEKFDDGYQIKINNLKGTRICHKIFLTSIRYLYEFPFSVVLYSALRFFETHPEAKQKHLYQILFISSIALSRFSALCSGHSLFNKFCTMSVGTRLEIPKEIIKQELQSDIVDENASINGFFDRDANTTSLRITDEISQTCKELFAYERNAKPLTFYHNIVDAKMQNKIQNLINLIYETVNQ